MKKSFVSLAAVAAFGVCASAQAQSSVSLYGLVDAAVGSFQDAGTTAVTKMSPGNMTTSFWGISSTEDLGGGLKAKAVLEGFFLPTNGVGNRGLPGDTLFSRGANVSLSGSFGTIELGRVTTSLFINTLIFSSMGDSFSFAPSIRQTFVPISAYSVPSDQWRSAVQGDTGWNESVKYSSPSFGGLSFTAHQAIKGTSPGDNTGASALYFGGPFAAGAAWQQIRKEASTTTNWNVGASYDLGAAKLFGQYGQHKNDTNGTKYTISGLGVSVPMGAGVLMGQWGQRDATFVKTSLNNTNKTTTLIYDYNLSKRTDVYAALMLDQLTGKSDGSTYGVGLRHRF